MKKIFTLLFIAGALLAVQSCGGGDAAGESSSEKVLLRLQPEVGAKKTLVMDLTSKISGMAMETKMGMTTEMTIKNVAQNGDVEMETVYTHVMMKINAMGQSMGYDSATDSINPEDPTSVAYIGLASMLNKPISMTMDKLGKVTKAPDLDALLPDSIKALTGQTSNAQAGQMFENMFSVFPDAEVGEGESWERETEMNTDKGPMKLKAKYTVSKIEKETVTLTMDGTLEGNVADQMGGNIKMTGTMKGTLLIDRKTGWTNKVDLTQDLVMNTMGMKMNATNTIVIESK